MDGTKSKIMSLGASYLRSGNDQGQVRTDSPTLLHFIPTYLHIHSIGVPGPKHETASFNDQEMASPIMFWLCLVISLHAFKYKYRS